MVPTLERLMERFLASPAGQALAADEESANAKDRTRVVGRLKELEIEGHKRSKNFDATHAKARSEFDRAKANMEKAAYVVENIAREWLAETWRTVTERAELEQMLENTCAPKICEFVAEVELAIEQVQRHGLASRQVDTRSTLCGAPVRVFESNASIGYID